MYLLKLAGHPEELHWTMKKTMQPIFITTVFKLKVSIAQWNQARRKTFCHIDFQWKYRKPRRIDTRMIHDFICIILVSWLLYRQADLWFLSRSCKMWKEIRHFLEIICEPNKMLLKLISSTGWFCCAIHNLFRFCLKMINSRYFIKRYDPSSVLHYTPHSISFVQNWRITAFS